MSLPSMGLHRVVSVHPVADSLSIDCIPTDVLRAYVHSLRTKLADADLEAILRVCDASKGQRLWCSLSALEQLATLGHPP